MRALFIALALSSATVLAEQRLDEQGQPCEDLVDLSESGQFHRLHFECAKSKPALNTYEASAAVEGVNAPVQTPVAGKVFHIRAPWVAAQPVAATLESLYRQMRQHCPAGWHRAEEWSLVEDGDLYLHRRFACR
jgi:hypothetical protein